MLKKRWISKQSYLCQLFKAMGNCKQGSVKFVGLKLSSWTDGSIFVALENRKKLVLKYFGLIFPSGSLIWCFLIVNFLFSNPFRCPHQTRTNIWKRLLKIFSESGVAQWLACWAHNPKVPGLKPGSAMHALIQDWPVPCHAAYST